MDLKPQIRKVISNTCTHWICADEEDLNRVETELEKDFELIINAEIERRKPDADTASKCNKHIVNGWLLYDFPENMPLYKDSGLWQLRSDDMEDVVLQQGVNESDNDFIERCIACR